MSDAGSLIENDATVLDRAGRSGECRSLDSLRPCGVDGLELRFGIGRYWAWPKDDDILWATMLLEHQTADRLVSITRGRRPQKEGHISVLQAGGACGVMPWKLAQHSDVIVRSFEPVRINHLAATINLAATERAFVHHGALMATCGWVGMAQEQRANAGSWLLTDNRENAAPAFGSQHLQAHWDLVWLDMEGAEFGVISGLLDDLASFDAPYVIAIELKGQAERYGWTDAWTISTIEGAGYVLREWLGNDAVFVRT